MTSLPTVAVLGINGRIGKPVLNALLSPEYSQYYAMPVRALTSGQADPSSAVAPNDSTKVKYFQVSTDTPETLAKALKGVDILINTSSSRTDYKVVVDQAVQAGVQVYFPSDFDIDFGQTPFHNVFKGKLQALEYARNQPWKSIEVKCGLFGEYMLTHSFNFGLDVKSGVYTRYGNGNTPVAVTFLGDVAKSVAAIAHRAYSCTGKGEEIPNKLLIQGDLISRDDYVALFEECTGKKFDHVDVGAADTLAGIYKLNLQDTITRPEKFKAIQGLYCLGPGIYSFEKNHNDLVGIEWQKFEPAARALWNGDFKHDEGL